MPAKKTLKKSPKTSVLSEFVTDDPFAIYKTENLRSPHKKIQHILDALDAVAEQISAAHGLISKELQRKCSEEELVALLRATAGVAGKANMLTVRPLTSLDHVRPGVAGRLAPRTHG